MESISDSADIFLSGLDFGGHVGLWDFPGTELNSDGKIPFYGLNWIQIGFSMDWTEFRWDGSVHPWTKLNWFSMDWTELIFFGPKQTQSINIEFHKIWWAFWHFPTIPINVLTVFCNRYDQLAVCPIPFIFEVITSFLTLCFPSFVGPMLEAKLALDNKFFIIQE